MQQQRNRSWMARQNCLCPKLLLFLSMKPQWKQPLQTLVAAVSCEAAFVLPCHVVIVMHVFEA